MGEISAPAEKSPDRLSEKDQKKLTELKKRLDSSDPNTIIQYGVEVQNKISEFADQILSEVRSRDTGYVGKVLTDLMNRLKEMRLDSLSGQPRSFWARIPFLGSLVDGTQRFLSKYQTISVQLVQIMEELDSSRNQLLNDVVMLEHFYKNNIEYVNWIGLYILAGEQKLKELQEDVLPRMQAEAEASDQLLEIQKYRDLVQFAARLEKKVYDLKLSRTVALQTAPQIRLIQNNNQELATKIQSSILNTIPLWKHQMVIAITLLRQSQVSGLQRQISDTTREILEKNAAMLKVGAAEIAQEAERGIVDLDTLKKVNADLISTIEETIKLQQEGRIRRKEAEKEIIKIETELKQKLLEMKNKARNESTQ